MKNYLSLAALAAGLLCTSLSFGQTPTTSAPKKTAAGTGLGMMTIFPAFEGNLGKTNYLGLSVGGEIQYSMLAGQFTPMAGVSGMVHFNKRFAIGAAAYSTIAENFTPTSLNTNKALAVNTMYGGLKLEFTPKPDAKVHVSFPLLIGMGMAQVDSVNSRDGREQDHYMDPVTGMEIDREGHDNHDGNGNHDNGGSEYFLIQPGVNLEINLIRYVKFTLGASYRIVPTVSRDNAATTVSAYPALTASQLSGLNVTAGLRIGLFDYQLRHRRKVKNEE